VKPALLVIDVQKAFFGFSEATAKSLEEAIEYVNAAIDLFRERELPVFVVQHMEEEDNLVPGTEGFELPEELKIKPDDPHIVKTYGNAFNKTSLADDLQELGVDTLIITGFCAEYCVLSTFRGAQDLDLKPILLRGAIASGDRKRIGFVMDICDVISYGALKAILD
jgi:nicotinamidase-related amidase